MSLCNSNRKRGASENVLSVKATVDLQQRAMGFVTAPGLLSVIFVVAVHADYFNGNSLNELFNSERAIDLAMARGYVAGIQDTYNGRLFCVQPEVKLSQAAAVVEKYLRDHPEEWHRAAHALVLNAIAQAFPCKTQSK